MATFPEFSQPVSPPGPQTQGTLTCVAFSHKGDLLAACDDQGLVHVWLLPPDFSTRPKVRAVRLRGRGGGSNQMLGGHLSQRGGAEEGRRDVR